MKKLLMSLGILCVLGGIVSYTSASSSCKEVEFANNVNACVNIEYASSNRRTLETTVDSGSTSNLRCDIMTPDSGLRSISACNGEFSYNGNKAGRVKLRIRYSNAAPTDWEDKPNSNSQRTYPQWIYDFDDRERYDDGNYYDNDDSDYDTDNFYLTTDDATPATSQYVDITVKARDGSSTDEDYRGTVQFKVYYKSSSSSTWTQTTSSTYYTMVSTYEDDGYTFTSSNDGEKTFTNLIKFNKNNYSYKIVVYDEDDEDIQGYKIFSVGTTSSSDYDTDNFYLTTDDATPATSQYVDITVKARDGSSTDEDYRGTVQFKVYYKSSSSSTWTQTTSSTYYTMVSTYEDDGYTFTSSNDGEKTFTNLIKFNRNNYSYKVVVYDEDDENIQGYKTFTVGTTSNSDYDTDNFYLTTDDTTPEINQYVDLTIRARDGSSTDEDYRGTVQFKVYYRASSSYAWTQTTSLSYYEMKYPYEDNGFTFSSSHDGQVTITDFIRFRRSGYEYKIVVIDEDNDIEEEKIFTVDDSEENDNDYDADNFYLTTDDTTPATSQYVDITVRARDGSSTDEDYRGTVQFKVYYKSSSSSTWTQTTSSTYYTMVSTYEDDGYTFTSSNDGEKTFTNLIKFNRNNYSYKVVVYDEDDENIQGYKTFTVGTTSSSYDSDVDGFTESELNVVEGLYEGRDAMIQNLKDRYSRLRNHTTRQNRSDEFYDEMEKILDDDSDREYDDYDEFYDGRLSRYNYTVSVR